MVKYRPLEINTEKLNSYHSKAKPQIFVELFSNLLRMQIEIKIVFKSQQCTSIVHKFLF